MSSISKNGILCGLLITTAAMTYVVKPRIMLADERAPINLAAMVPSSFGEWREQPTSVQIVNPQTEEMLGELYSETLSRTYANDQGYRIMLSIAYGKEQRGKLQLHRPDVCYEVQGFTLNSQARGTLALQDSATIPAMRFTTSLKQRKEPVTFWMVVGDQVALTRTDQKMVEMHYALRQRIPDGMLVRVSSIDGDSRLAFRMQEEFARQMIASLPGEARPRFAGRVGGVSFVAQLP